MRYLLMSLLAAVLVLPAAVLGAPAAHAAAQVSPCVCETPDLSALAARADLVAQVRVLREEERDGQRVTHVEVHREWVGEGDARLEVTAPDTCAPRLQPGTRILLLARGGSEQGWRVPACGGALEVGTSGADLTWDEVWAQLGTPRVVEAPSDEDSHDWWRPRDAGMLCVSLVITVVAGVWQIMREDDDGDPTR